MCDRTERDLLRIAPLSDASYIGRPGIVFNTIAILQLDKFYAHA